MEKKSKKVDELLALAKGKKRALIMPHNYADPDAIATALAIKNLLQKKLGLPGTISFNGVVGREENRVLCKALSIEIVPTSQIHFDDFDFIILVDCQPGPGNSALPDSLVAHAIIDHHPADSNLKGVTFLDIRNDVGASSTIATEYLVESKAEISPGLAAALVYGIKTDSLNIAIKTKESDIRAYLHLFPLADLSILNSIENASLPKEYFKTLNDAIEDACIYDNVVVTDLKDVANPGAIGEFADLFLRLADAETSLCFGVYDETLMISIRTVNLELNAGKIIRYAVGERGTAGGHAYMAGGQIPLVKETREEKIEHINAVRNKVFNKLSIKGKRKKRIA
ncbi:MAG: DHHA1 domain-containing protein [Deltaproteobacteria bacterium]|nr:DHHA1 domain-containing protein [Deltaproteobacteria bacterium]